MAGGRSGSGAAHCTTMCKLTTENICCGCLGMWCFMEMCDQKKELGGITPKDHVIQVDETTNSGRMKGGVCKGCSKKLREEAFDTDPRSYQNNRTTMKG